MFITGACIACAITVLAQKKPLDHSVYDSWQRIGERIISNDGNWVVYTIVPQEGDNELVIQSTDKKYTKTIPRGSNAVITEDARFVVFSIKPPFNEIREARIKKKNPADLPKDSIAIVELGKESVWKRARVKTYKTPEKGTGWVAYHLEKSVEKKELPKKAEAPDKRRADSLMRVVDSLQQVIQQLPVKKKKRRDSDDSGDGVDFFAPDDEAGEEPGNTATAAGTELVLRNLLNGEEKSFTRVLDFSFSKNGEKLLLELSGDAGDSLSKPAVVLYNIKNGYEQVLSKGGNDFKGFVFSADGEQLAWLAERDARPKELQKFYKLWYYKTGLDSAVMLVDKNTVGMKLGNTVSEYGTLSFSKSGNRLFFGTAAIQPPKDTSLVDTDLAKLDIWHYKDDYLQPQQLLNLQRSLQASYMAVFHLDKQELVQLGNEELPVIYPANEGDGDQFVGVTDWGKRVEGQWTGRTKKDIYAVDVHTGNRQLVKKDLNGLITPQFLSPSGAVIAWYDFVLRQYVCRDARGERILSKQVKVPLWNEEDDMPADPAPYGVMGWHTGDSALYVYDKYDVWKLPVGSGVPVNETKTGRTQKLVHRYLRTDPEERFLRSGQQVIYRLFNEVNKHSGLRIAALGDRTGGAYIHTTGAFSVGAVQKAKMADALIYTRENFQQSPDLFAATGVFAMAKDAAAAKQQEKPVQLSSINPQQQSYNWGTAALYKWKAFTGKIAEGVLYTPENFDPAKKYPLILYFYETHSNALHTYIPPSPTGSRLNISFFVSRGYVVFSPDIHYTVGHPAKDCYNHVVSAAQTLAKEKWIDATKIGIQGQSWGGIQVAQLITMTNMFKAAWAGAPVANMTSAYGGIRWESGVNRQFQYEKTQSRIGASLWEKPNLYIENSPLFHLPKVKTPLVIMANDADGAVPWYQGIELFTAMRRLGKQVWMLNYNGEAHNLRERRNQKDISVREQQYFDWLLKGEKAPRWLTDGVPAVLKGKDWGLEY